MRVTCRACGVEVDHVSLGCVEHARREAELVHLHRVASGFACFADCPVCVQRRRMVRVRRAGVR